MHKQLLSMFQLAFIAISREQSEIVTRERREKREEVTVLFSYLLFPAESSKNGVDIKPKILAQFLVCFRT